MNIINAEDPESLYTNSATKLEWRLKAGLNVWANDNIGIKLQVSLLFTAQGVGGDLNLGTGNLFRKKCQELILLSLLNGNFIF